MRCHARRLPGLRTRLSTCCAKFDWALHGIWCGLADAFCIYGVYAASHPSPDALPFPWSTQDVGEISKGLGNTGQR